jgi:hypothetical protein
MSNTTDLITFLVDETYKEAEGISDVHLVYFFDSKRDCIVLCYKEKSLEIPVLWSQVDSSVNYYDPTINLLELLKNDEAFNSIVKIHFGGDIDLTNVVNQNFQHIEAA